MKGQEIRHLDEARDYLIDCLKAEWKKFKVARILIIEDSFGRFSLGAWGSESSEKFLKKLMAGIAPFDSGAIFWSSETPDAFDPLELEASWEEASSIVDEDEEWDERIRITVRHRMLPAWKRIAKEPLWRLKEDLECPIVAFYSFKGGMGRTTALSLFAVSRALQNEHVVVIDLDLDAPGLGSILAPGSAPPYGVVDYLIESPVLRERPKDLLDYSWNVDLGSQRTTGSLRVFPAGNLDRNYLGKMARLDFETEPELEGVTRHPVEELILHIHDKFQPDWILVDSRTGFSETAGMLLSGLCHFHVLFGVDSDQSWEGVNYAVRKLGAERVSRNLPQAETMMIHAMVPDYGIKERESLLGRFTDRAQEVFAESYFARDEADRNETFWYLNDGIGDSSPCRPWPLPYRMVLAQSFAVEDLVNVLGEKEFQAFCSVLAVRARGGNPEEAI